MSAETNHEANQFEGSNLTLDSTAHGNMAASTASFRSMKRVRDLGPNFKHMKKIYIAFIGMWRLSWIIIAARAAAAA